MLSRKICEIIVENIKKSIPNKFNSNNQSITVCGKPSDES